MIVGHLRRPRRSRRRDGSDRRRRRHAGDRLALDLLDQRSDRPDRRASRLRLLPESYGARGAPRPRRSRACHRRRRRPRLGAHARERRRLVERRGRRRPGRRGVCCLLAFVLVGESCRRADGAAAPVRGPRLRDRQRDDIPDVGRHRSPARSWSPRSFSSRATTPALEPGCACFRSSRRRCSSRRSPALSPIGSAADRSSSSV